VRRHPHRRHPERPARPSLAAIVRGCGCPEEQFAYYLAFAREIELTLRRRPQAASRKFQAQDFSSRTKRVVAKWFGRGLSGHVMWLIGDAIMRRGTG